MDLTHQQKVTALKKLKRRVRWCYLDYSFIGLCLVIHNLYANHKLSSKEKHYLSDLIWDSLRSPLTKTYTRSYLFKPGKIRIRIKWLQKHIEIEETYY